MVATNDDGVGTRGNEAARRGQVVKRRTFAEILRLSEIDPGAEYNSLYEVTHEVGLMAPSFFDIVRDHFDDVPFRETAASLDDFEQRYDLGFEYGEGAWDFDRALTFCEYVGNLARGIAGSDSLNAYERGKLIKVIGHADKTLDRLGYRFADDGGILIAVERDAAADEAAALVPKKIVGDVFRYRHRSFRGDVDGKARILSGIGNELEPRRDELKSVCPQAENDLFFMLNNLNIRHNNLSSENGSKYNAALAAMSADEQEEWLDRTYDLCMTAILLLSYQGWRDELRELKRSISG